MEKNKKIIYILIAVIVIFVFIMALINKNCQKNNSTSATNQINVAKTYNAISQKAIEEKIFYPYVESANEIIGLSDKGIIFYKFNPEDKSKLKLIDQEILGTEQAYYSLEGSQTVIMSNYPNKNVKYVDFNSKNVKDLSSKINQVYFSRKQNIIYYSYYDSEKNIWNFTTSNPDGSSWQNIAELKNSGNADFAVSPAEDKAIIFYSWVGTKTSPSYSLDISTKKLTELDRNLDIKNVVWSPDGKKIAYLDSNSQLYIATNDFSQKQKFDIKTPDYKLSWKDNNNLVAAIARNFEYNTSQIGIDDFYIINTADNSINKINIDSGQGIEDITFLQTVGNQIYFVSNSYLYLLKLSQ